MNEQQGGIIPSVLTETQNDEILSFAAELVRCSGESGKERNCAEAVRRKMEDLGYDQVLTDEYGSVLGVLRGSGSGPTLLFDGHTDVVPVREPDKWTHDPYGGEVSEGRLWGRGSTDMKGALAAMVCAPAFMDRRDFSGTILVSASVAEEMLIGTALDHVLQNHPADAVVIGEPTGLKLGNAEKGRASLEMICHGTVAHSSRPDLGDNAIYRMMEAARRIRSLPRRSHPVLGEEVIELVELSSLPAPGNGSIPGRCRALWECRLLPGESEEEFLLRWHQALEGVGRTELRIAEYSIDAYTGHTMKMQDFLPGWTGDEESRGLLSLAADALRAAGRGVEYYAAPYGCNALVSAARRKIPTVILGPGDISAAHKPDESLLIQELQDAAAVYSTLSRNLMRLRTVS